MSKVYGATFVLHVAVKVLTEREVLGAILVVDGFRGGCEGPRFRKDHCTGIELLKSEVCSFQCEITFKALFQ
jgi:hypothetical protein